MYVYIYKFKVLENVVFSFFLICCAKPNMHLAQFCWFLFFFFLIVMQLCRLIYTYMYIYVHADIQLFVINRLFLLLHLLIFDYFDYILSVSNWTKYNTGISAWQAKSPFRPFDGFQKKNQYPFIMQHELHWNRKIRLSQSINEAKHLLCVNARAKERVSEWVSVSQPASTKPGRRKRILFCGSQRLTGRQAVDVVVGRDLPQ